MYFLYLIVTLQNKLQLTFLDYTNYTFVQSKLLLKSWLSCFPMSVDKRHYSLKCLTNKDILLNFVLGIQPSSIPNSHLVYIDN